MRLTPHLLIAASLLSTTTISSTAALAPASASALLASSLVLSGSSALVAASAGSDAVPAAKRNFRIGHPAVLSQRPFSTMTSTASSQLPAQDDAFPGFSSTPHLDPSPTAAERIAGAMDLFSARPSPTIFSRSWSPSAIFADPICHANGAKQYLAQWYGMPAAFAESRTLT